ncbi:MAG TPA: DUF6325 family protein [Thermomicrobiales bacterium]|nr:DUF6325 family protein [Thermomicrobiales bacterium]
MPTGPIEMLAVKFPGNRFTGEIAPALADLVESDTIRLIDILFVRKDADGLVEVTEISELDDDTYAAFDLVTSDMEGLMSEDDGQRISALLEPNSSAAVMVFENTWASRFTEAMRNADGEVVFNERIPRAVIDEMMAEIDANS